jgi:hypothetical protein
MNLSTDELLIAQVVHAEMVPQELAIYAEMVPLLR